MIALKIKTALISILCSLILCSCSAEDDSESIRETSASDDHSIAETETTTQTTATETLSSEAISVSSEEESSSAYFPEILESAAAFDNDSSLTDFDRMLKDVASFDVKEFFKDHNYVLDHFTGNMFATGKLFLIHKRKAFMGDWQYGKYILYMGCSPENNFISFRIWDIHHTRSGIKPTVAIRFIDGDGNDVPLLKEVTREDIDKELRMDTDSNPDSLTDEEKNDLLSLFDDSLIYDEENIDAFLKDYPN